MPATVTVEVTFYSFVLRTQNRVVNSRTVVKLLKTVRDRLRLTQSTLCNMTQMLTKLSRVFDRAVITRFCRKKLKSSGLTRDLTLVLPS